MNRGLIAYQNCENRVFIDRIVPEKNQVEVTAHLGKVPVRYRPNAASGGWSYGRDLVSLPRRA